MFTVSKILHVDWGKILRVDHNYVDICYFLVLDASTLMEHIIDIVDEVCQKWNKDLPAIPIPAQVHECYHYEIKNTRRKMEDKHVMLQDMNTLFDLKVWVPMVNLINTITHPQLLTFLLQTYPMFISFLFEFKYY